MTTRKWSPARVAKVWLDVVLALGGVATGLLVVWLLISPWLVGEDLPADTTATVAIGERTVFPRLPLEYSNDVAEFARADLANGYGELRTATTDWRLHFASVGPTALATLVILYSVWLLREVLRTVLAGEPFAPANSRRLRRIGWIVLALSAVGPLADYLLSQALLERLTVDSLPLSAALRIPRDGFLVGLLFLVLSAIFQHGTELEDERSLTV